MGIYQSTRGIDISAKNTAPTALLLALRVRSPLAPKWILKHRRKENFGINCTSFHLLSCLFCRLS